MRFLFTVALISLALPLVSCARAVDLPANGTFDGAPVDHSDGKGLLVIPPGWTPVNTNTDRGDRLSVEASDRPGGGPCLHVKTFGSDAGVYQTVAPLENNRTYLVSARVKRLSGTLALVAYPQKWGPAIMRVLDDSSSGWTEISTGLTTTDGGAHLYLVVAPEAEFLIDEVQIRPAALQLSAPVAAPYDFTNRWHYSLTLTALPGGKALPPEVRLQAVSADRPGIAYGSAVTVKLKPGRPTRAELSVPTRAEGSFAVAVSDARTGELLGSSALGTLGGFPWIVRYPYKHALYSSLSYRWPLRVEVRNATAASLAKLRAEVAITDSAGKQVVKVAGRSVAAGPMVDLDGRNLTPGAYHLRLAIRGGGGRRLADFESPLRVAPPAQNEVVCGPDGATLVNGRRFFPIGLYWVLADPAGWRPGPARKDADLLELKQAGFNTLHTYAFEHNDANDTDDNAVAYLDTAQELGLKVMMGLRRDWYQGQELNRAAIEQRVRRLREHPALLCWTLWDEPDSNLSHVSRVQEVYDLVDSLDLHHPAMPVFMSGGGRPFREAADINLFDCYPGAGNAGILPGVFARTRAALPEKPLWYVAQAYQQGDKLPSLEDMRQYWRIALQNGSQAILWYSYGGDAKGWDSIRITPEHFANTKQAVRELADTVSRRP